MNDLPLELDLLLFLAGLLLWGLVPLEGIGVCTHPELSGSGVEHLSSNTVSAQMFIALSRAACLSIDLMAVSLSFLQYSVIRSTA